MSGTMWLAWRRHRAVFMVGAVLTLGLVAYMLFMRFAMVGHVRDHGIEGCSFHFDLPDCHGVYPGKLDGRTQKAMAHFDDAYQAPMLTLGRALLAVPALVGVFVGAPLFAREWESGTHKLAWSQSVSRARWLAVMLGVPVAVTVACTAVIAAGYTWWWRGWPPATVMLTEAHWYNAVPYDISGPSGVALPLLALAAGAAIGLVVRRTLPAMATTLAVAVGLQFGMRWLRDGLLMPHESVTVRYPAFPSVPRGAWDVSLGYLHADGSRSTSGLDACRYVTLVHECLSGKATGRWAEYVPPSALWPVQWAEAGICLALAAALFAFCLWWAGREGRAST